MEAVINAKPLLRSSDDESDGVVDTPTRRVDLGDDSEIGDDGSDSRMLFKANEPLDRGYLVYVVFYLLGMTTLMPWNFFITAEEYWMYKFRDVHNETSSVDDRTPLQSSFMSYLSLASSLSTGTFLVLNTYLSQRIPLQIRMLSSLSIMLICFVVTTIFVKIDTDSWQEEFFIITMITVVILNMASAILSGGIVGVAGKFSAIYMTAVVSGQALGGIFAGLANILSLTFSVSAVFSTLIYFVIANATIVFALIAYIVAAKSIFFKYHTVERIRMSFEETVSLVTCPRVSIGTVLQKIWICAASIWITFSVSLAIFPAITGLIESQNVGQGYAWNDIFFVPVISYLLFSVGDYLGRVTAGIVQRPRRKVGLILFLNCCRIIFLPLLMLCNAQPRHHLPVLIPQDGYYILIMAMFAFSNGYVTNIAMITAPRLVEKHEHEMAAILMAALLGIGLASGAAFGTLLIRAL